MLAFYVFGMIILWPLTALLGLMLQRKHPIKGFLKMKQDLLQQHLSFVKSHLWSSAGRENERMCLYLCVRQPHKASLSHHKWQTHEHLEQCTKRTLVTPIWRQWNRLLQKSPKQRKFTFKEKRKTLSLNIYVAAWRGSSLSCFCSFITWAGNVTNIYVMASRRCRS